MAHSCPLSNTPKPISIDDDSMLRKDGNGILLVAIAKYPAIHIKAMSKYVAANLRGPKQVWVPSKSGWLIVGTIGIGGLVQVVFIVLIMWLSQVLKAMIIIPMPWQDSEVQELSTYKCYNSSCGDLLELFDGLQDIWVEAC